MQSVLAPGVYVQEVSGGARPIQAVGTSTAGFVGEAPDPNAHLNEARALNNWGEFVREFFPGGSTSTPLSQAVRGFFLNGGQRCYVVNVGRNGPLTGGADKRAGLDILEQIDEVAIVVAPGYTDAGAYEAVLGHCEAMKDRVAILDTPEITPDTNIDLLKQVATTGAAPGDDGDGKKKAAPAGLRPRQSDGGYGVVYVPWITVLDPLSNQPVDVAPSGHMAGVWARSDALRGVHKAPANEAIRGVINLTRLITAQEQADLNQMGVNCIRFFPREGIRVWGARTLADGSSEWRYLNVRRLFNMIEESIALSTRWIVFEPNDRTLWKSIRRDVSAFLTRLWRDGALMGRSPEEAFFVKCDEETNPPEVIDAGQVVTVIGIAPVKPAEFIIFQISQYAGGTRTETQGGGYA